MTDVEDPKVEELVVAEAEEDAVPAAEVSSESDDLKKDEKPEGEEETDEVGDENPFIHLRHLLLKGIWYAFLLLVVIYLLAAFIIDFERATALFVITVLVLVYWVYEWWLTKNEEAVLAAEDKVITFLEKCDTDLKTGAMLAGVLILIMVIMIAATVRDGRNMVSLMGLLVFIGLTWVFSWKPTKVMVRPVLGAIFIQFIFGYCVIRTDWGFNTMDFLSDIITKLLNYTLAGSSFVFNWLTDGSLFGRPVQLVDGGSYLFGPPFFFNVLPSVIFFSSLMSVGYYIGALPWAVHKLGYVLSILLGTSASESLSAAGNIFVGQTEAPLLVKPFFAEMTESELHAIMTGGFATIAGSVFGIYLSFGIDGTALLAASIMSAPAALAISKVAYPETEDSPTSIRKRGAFDIPSTGGGANVVDAAAKGAVVGTQLMLNIAGNLIAFLAMVEMIDQLLQYLGDRVDQDVSFNKICELFFFPFAWLMGVDGEDCDEVATLIGFKIIINEFFAYEQLAFSPDYSHISDRSYYIASYALCGFSNLGSIGIQLGGLTPLAPNQGPKLAKLVFSAMIAGNTACFMTACIAGIFYDADDFAGNSR